MTDDVKAYSAVTTAPADWTRLLAVMVDERIREQNRLLQFACETALFYGKGVRIATWRGLWRGIEVTSEVEAGTVEVVAHDVEPLDV